MLLCIANVLSADELDHVRDRLNRLRYVDGRKTAGWHAAMVKRNRQATASEELADLQALVRRALDRNPLIQIAARPRRVLPPLFSRYEDGMEYGRHVDDAVMGGADPMRTDIAMTLFLSDPKSYDGGELIVESTAGEESYKLDAGAAVIYPASSLHRVAPVTGGVRLAAVTWIQSLVRDPAQRELLFDLDTARRTLFDKHGKSGEFDLLSKSVANLLRMWTGL